MVAIPAWWHLDPLAKSSRHFTRAFFHAFPEKAEWAHTNHKTYLREKIVSPWTWIFPTDGVFFLRGHNVILFKNRKINMLNGLAIPIVLFSDYSPLKALYSTCLGGHARCQRLVGSKLGFSILLKDTLTCSRGSRGSKPATFRLPVRSHRAGAHFPDYYSSLRCWLCTLIATWAAKLQSGTLFLSFF